MNILEYLNKNLISGLHYRVYPDKNLVIIFEKNKELKRFSLLDNIGELPLGNGKEKYGVVLFRSNSIINTTGISGFQKDFDNTINKRKPTVSIQLYELANETDLPVLVNKENSYLLEKKTFQGYPSILIQRKHYYGLYKYLGNNEYILWKIYNSLTMENIE